MSYKTKACAEYAKANGCWLYDCVEGPPMGGCAIQKRRECFDSARNGLL